MPNPILAGADLRLKKGYAVKISAGTAILVAAVTDVPYGILENAPNTGEKCTITRTGSTKAVIGAGGVTRGQRLGSAADGRLVPYVEGTDITKYINAVAEQDAAAGQLADVELIAVPHRAV